MNYKYKQQEKTKEKSMTKISIMFVASMIMLNVLKADEQIIWTDISNCKEFYKKYEPNRNIESLDLSYTDYCGNPKEYIFKTDDFAKAYKIFFNSTNQMELLPNLPNQIAQYNNKEYYADISYTLDKNEIKILIESTECDGYTLIIFKRILNEIHISMSYFNC